MYTVKSHFPAAIHKLACETTTAAALTPLKEAQNFLEAMLS